MAITKLSSGSSFTNLQKYDSFLAGNPAFSPSSFESIATYTATGTNSVIFSSIPSTFQSLQLRVASKNVGGSSALSTMYIKLNGSTSNYTLHRLFGNGATVTAQGYASGVVDAFYATPGSADNGATNVQAVFILDLLDYTSTTKNKTARWIAGADNNGAGRVELGSGLWIDTTAITSITVATNDNFTASSIALYGIKGA